MYHEIFSILDFFFIFLILVAFLHALLDALNQLNFVSNDDTSDFLVIDEGII